MNKKCLALGTKRSQIREMFEYGKKRKAEIGEDKVFDFSIGNPSVLPPKEVKEQLIDLLNTMPENALHGYTSAQGNEGVRRKIAENLRGKMKTEIPYGNIFMTCGAAASLSVVFKAITESDKDEIILFAPYFPEYSVFIENAGAKKTTVAPSEDFQIDFDDLIEKINKNTKAVVVNSPNNPSGAVYSEKTLKTLAAILKEKEKEYSKTIYIISDEPYREISYVGCVPEAADFYADTVICYSYSKSLSLPGERIGYIAVSPKCKDSQNLYAAVAGAARLLGYVNSPSLFQNLLERIDGVTSDMEMYRKNRDAIYNALTEMGYNVVKPDGAFYLFVKALEEDANKFAERAKTFELLLVPSDSFGVNGYVRIAYCVTFDQIINSIPSFKKLFDSYKL